MGGRKCDRVDGALRPSLSLPLPPLTRRGLRCWERDRPEESEDLEEHVADVVAAENVDDVAEGVGEGARALCCDKRGLGGLVVDSPEATRTGRTRALARLEEREVSG